MRSYLSRLTLTPPESQFTDAILRHSVLPCFQSQWNPQGSSRPLLRASDGQASGPQLHAELAAAADPNIANRVYSSSVFWARARSDG